jgi:hypothetical protein
VNKKLYGIPEIPLDLPLILGSEGLNQPILPGQPGLIDEYKKLRTRTRTRFNVFKNSQQVQKFTLYQPFNLDKERIFTYVQDIQGNVDPTKNDYFNKTFAGQNGGALDKFNLKYSFN